MLNNELELHSGVDDVISFPGIYLLLFQELSLFYGKLNVYQQV